MMNQKKIGKFIADLRKAQKMTQEQLAERLGVSNRSVSRWENGNSMPDLSLLQNISKELGVSISELLNGEKQENTSAQKDGIDLVVEFSDREKVRKAKKLNNYFFAGLVCLLLVILHDRFGILIFLKGTSSEQFVLGLLICLGVLFEAAGFYCNRKGRSFTSKEIEIISNSVNAGKMKTAGEMLQFARKYQKAELKQYELAFQKIAECLEEDEEVSFSMVGDSYTINDNPGPWHICGAVTQKRLLIAGEKVRGRMMTGYDMDCFNLCDVKSVELEKRRIVIRTSKELVKLEGEKFDTIAPMLKKAVGK